MKFHELIKQLAVESGLPQTRTRRLVDRFLDLTARQVVIADRFAVPGFGVFTRRVRKERTIRNPQTKELEVIGATVSIRFRLSKPGAFARYLKRAPWAKSP